MKRKAKRVKAPDQGDVLIRFLDGLSLCDIARELGRKTVPPGLSEADAARHVLNYYKPCEKALRRAVMRALNWEA